MTIDETYNIIPDGTILLSYAGSTSHGTKIPSSDPNSIDDIDILGTAIGPEEVYYGLKHFEQKEVKKGEFV